MPNPVLTPSKTTAAPGDEITITGVYSGRVQEFALTDQDGLTGTCTITVAGHTFTATPTQSVTKVSETGTATRTVTYKVTL
jgi:hypothetical protein